MKSDHNRRDGESKKKTLQRLALGRSDLKRLFVKLASSVDWGAHPLVSESYDSFEQTCYEQYLALVKGIVYTEAYVNAPDNPYDPADHVAILALGSLKVNGKDGEYYARNICERLAKAWANGEHSSTHQRSGTGGAFTPWEKRQDVFGETGVTIQGGLLDFAGCLRVYKELPEQLTSSLTETEAKIFADRYQPVCSLYNSMVRRM